MRRAAVVLTDDADSADSLGVHLLADLRAVFGEARQLPTSAILHGLHALEEAPWRSLKGVPLDDRGLARLVWPYDVRPRQIRLGETTPRGVLDGRPVRPMGALPSAPARGECNSENEGNSAGQSALVPGGVWTRAKRQNRSGSLTRAVLVLRMFWPTCPAVGRRAP